MVDLLGSTHGFVDERRRRALAHSSVCASCLVVSCLVPVYLTITVRTAGEWRRQPPRTLWRLLKP